MSTILPVIHVQDEKQAERNLNRALEASADGVFLINHGIHASDLAVIHRELRSKYPDQWIGVNFLGLRPHHVVQLVQGVSGVWMDDFPPSPLGLDIPVFGGVAFKHQRPRGTLSYEVQLVEPSVDVLVTSGPATGEPPTIEKIRQLRSYASKPIGIASGMTPDNVAEFVPLTDYFLVATGVSQNFHELDPAKLKAFVAAVRA